MFLPEVADVLSDDTIAQRAACLGRWVEYNLVRTDYLSGLGHETNAGEQDSLLWGIPGLLRKRVTVGHRVGYAVSDVRGLIGVGD